MARLAGVGNGGAGEVGIGGVRLGWAPFGSFGAAGRALAWRGWLRQQWIGPHSRGSACPALVGQSRIGSARRAVAGQRAAAWARCARQSFGKHRLGGEPFGSNGMQCTAMAWGAERRQASVWQQGCGGPRFAAPRHGLAGAAKARRGLPGQDSNGIAGLGMSGCPMARQDSNAVAGYGEAGSVGVRQQRSGWERRVWVGRGRIGSARPVKSRWASQRYGSRGGVSRGKPWSVKASQAWNGASGLAMPRFGMAAKPRLGTEGTGASCYGSLWQERQGRPCRATQRFDWHGRTIRERVPSGGKNAGHGYHRALHPTL